MQQTEGHSEARVREVVRELTRGARRQVEHKKPWDLAELLVVYVILSEPNVSYITSNNLTSLLKKAGLTQQMAGVSVHVLSEMSFTLLQHARLRLKSIT